MAHHGVGPDDTLFVGDAEVDREAARRAGVAFLDVRDLLAQSGLAPSAMSSPASSSHQKT